MDNLNSKLLKHQTAQRLEEASYPPRHLALLHSGIALVCSLALTVVTYLLSRQISGTGGLAGIGTRTVLQSIQSVLSTALTVGMPFWEFGFIAAAMGYARQEGVGPKDLLTGFRRFGPILRLLLLQMVIYGLIAVAVTQIASTVVMMSPFGAGMLDVMQTLSGNTEFMQTGVFPEEMMEQLLKAAIPVYVVAGALFLAASIPVAYRLRLARYMVLDAERPRALACLLQSNRAMKGNCLALFKLDLSFWWYWALQGVCSLLAFGDVLLPLVGIELPFGADGAMFLFYGLQLAGSLALAWAWRAPVETAYALAYDAITEE